DRQRRRPACRENARRDQGECDRVSSAVASHEPMTTSTSEENADLSGAVVVIGAGADVSFKLPTIPNLVRELAEFSNSDGKAVNAALRGKLPRLQFSFNRA